MNLSKSKKKDDPFFLSILDLYANKSVVIIVENWGGTEVLHWLDKGMIMIIREGLLA